MGGRTLIRDPKTVEWATVRRSGERVGTLRRTGTGTEFAYDDTFLGRVDAKDHRVAFHLPLSQKVHPSTSGLHPFFSGLLPEGRRLISLQRRLKLSLDDDFSFLVFVGGNTIGDISVHPEDDPQPSIVPLYRSIDEADFERLFRASIGESDEMLHDTSIAGIIEKVSDAVIAVPVPKLGPFILKLQPHDLPNLIQNEHFVMGLARTSGIPTAKTAIREDKNGRHALLVQRFDRAPEPLHSEDGCQFLNLLPRDKYTPDARQVCEGLVRWSTAPQVEILAFLRLYTFSYLVGNGDLHAKNITLLRRRNGTIGLSPSYDLLSTLPYPGYDQRMALKLDGRDDRFRVRQIVDFGVRFGLRAGAVEGALRSLAERVGRGLGEFPTIGFDDSTNERVWAAQRSRIGRFLG